MADLEYRVGAVEHETKNHAEQIAKISNDLGDIKSLISQIRAYVTGGIAVFLIDKFGFFEVLQAIQ
jgi:wobble nucleotide-excising tRNase